MYPIADMLTMIKNAQNAGKERLLVPFSAVKFEIARILKEAGFVSEVERKKKKIKKTEHNFVEVKINRGEQARLILGIKLISKPSRRVYAKISEIKPVMSGYGISIISTSNGIMSGEEARKQNLGGEVIAEIW
ncbi:MAG: small subunit ribosomal protein S8 [Parcubacteria group bacterium Gr01-1014_44]|nr:MAG: small subunit ribosomal protein S8 [Parcubacteria group bacterium Gr01-1014_44]